MHRFILIGIVLLFLITRLYKIDQIPASVYWDEASIGYNAYSVLMTGKDEWGNLLPVHFRAFGEFKLPVYIYSVVPIVRIFGLNELSVRVPAVIFSAFSLVLIYLIAKKIFNESEVGLIAASIFGMSSWYFPFSRTGFEVTAGGMFFLLGIYLFLNHPRKIVFLVLSTLSFILSLYSYNGFRILAPITMVYLWLSLPIFRSKKYILALGVSIVLFIISIIPIAKLIMYDAGISRLNAIGVGGSDNLLSSLIKNYFSHFSFDFLLINGDKVTRHQMPDVGQIYIVELLFLILGIFLIFRKRSLGKFLPLFLLIIAPFPAMITKEAPHALRSILIVPAFSLLAGFGIYSFCEWLGQKSKMPKRQVINGLVILILMIFGVYFLDYYLKYINDYNRVSSADWQYGYKKIYTDYQDKFQNYQNVIIDDRLAQPYIFALFYLRYSPEKFLSDVEYNSVDKWGYSTVSEFNNFKFLNTGETKELDGNQLIFSTQKIDQLPPLGEIKNLDNSVAFYVYAKNI